MSNLVFPSLPGLVFPVRKTPTWKTNIKETVGGLETRITYWTYPIWKYSIGFDVLRDNALNELWTLIGFYNRHRGAFESWLFRDPDDYIVSNEVFGAGDGTRTSFQLSRTRGGYTEPVVRPVDGTVVIKVNGTTMTEGVHYSRIPIGIGANTGNIVFVNPPANNATLTWSGEFYWRCRFEDDEMDFEKFANQMWESGEVNFRSLKV